MEKEEERGNRGGGRGDVVAVESETLPASRQYGKAFNMSLAFTFQF